MSEKLRSLGFETDISKMFLLTDWEGGVWAASKDLSGLNFEALNVSSIGLRVAVKEFGSLRLLAKRI